MAGRVSAALSAVAEVNRTRRPEHDVGLRLRILGAVELGVLAVALAGAAPAVEAALVLALLPVGFAWSHRQRTSSNYAAKAVISALVVVVLWRFFRGVLGISTVDDARLPLTLLFLEIQVLHAFDLPQRRDLVFTLASSLALVALGLADGPGAWLLPVLLAYLVLAAASLHRYQRSVDAELLETAAAVAVVRPAAPPGGSSVRWRPVRQAVALAAVGALVFAAVPVRADAALGGLPFQLGVGGPDGVEGSRRVGGDLPFGDSDGEGSREVDPLEYFGFAERVDPRSVAQLSDTPVLRVRTDRPRPLRGVVFDVYADGVWGRSEEEPPPTTGLPVPLRPTGAPGRPTDRVVQTVELLRPTPNLVFGAADPVEVWTAARSATVWGDGTITTGIEMSAGTVYSVVSAVDVVPLEALRRRPFAYDEVDPAQLARWTELPDTVPRRVRDLAADLALAAPAQTPVAIAEAIQAHLGATVAYTIDVDPTPRDADPVDHLLFASQAGWCEPIATAMVVMLRSVGIPARFVTGFQPGDRGILSGRYTVRASDAHAWVEVLVPDHGWVAFDPTGATTAALDPEGPGAQVLLLDALRWVVDRLPEDPATRAALAAAVIGLLAAAAVSAVAARRIRTRRRLARAGPWAQLLHRLAAEGLDVPPSDTPAEAVDRARRALPHLDPAELDALREAEEHRRYATTT